MFATRAANKPKIIVGPASGTEIKFAGRLPSEIGDPRLTKIGNTAI